MHLHLDKLTVSALLTVAVTSVFWHLPERAIHGVWEWGFGSGDQRQPVQLSSAAKTDALPNFDMRWSSVVFRAYGSFGLAKLGGTEFGGYDLGTIGGGYDSGTTFGGYDRKATKSPRVPFRSGKQSQRESVAQTSRKWSPATYSYDTWSPDVITGDDAWSPDIIRGDDSWASEVTTGNGVRRLNTGKSKGI